MYNVVKRRWEVEEVERERRKVEVGVLYIKPKIHTPLIL
jgi:hypothetical protein